MKLPLVTLTSKTGSITVRDDVFGAPINQQAMAQAIRVFMSNQRQGTSKVKTRGEINRTKKKWFKQKGTGNARHGARTPNIFVGGGVAHGPTGLQNWTRTMPKTMRDAALVSALTSQVKNIIVCDNVNDLDGKAKSGESMLKNITPKSQRILVVLPSVRSKVSRSLQNIERVLMASATQLNTYQVAAADSIVFTSEAIEALQNRMIKKAKKEKAPTVKSATKSTAKPASKSVTKSAPVKKATVKPATKPAAKAAAKPKATPAKSKVKK